MAKALPQPAMLARGHRLRTRSPKKPSHSKVAAIFRMTNQSPISIAKTPIEKPSAPAADALIVHAAVVAVEGTAVAVAVADAGMADAAVAGADRAAIVAHVAAVAAVIAAVTTNRSFSNKTKERAKTARSFVSSLVFRDAIQQLQMTIAQRRGTARV